MSKWMDDWYEPTVRPLFETWNIVGWYPNAKVPYAIIYGRELLIEAFEGWLLREVGPK
jgi:hypothetical protein